MKIVGYYHKSLDSDNDLLLSVVRKKEERGRRKERREGGGKKEKKYVNTLGAMSHVLSASLYKICAALNLGWQLKMLYYNTFKCLQNL